MFIRVKYIYLRFKTEKKNIVVGHFAGSYLRIFTCFGIHKLDFGFHTRSLKIELLTPIYPQKGQGICVIFFDTGTNIYIGVHAFLKSGKPSPAAKTSAGVAPFFILFILPLFVFIFKYVFVFFWFPRQKRSVSTSGCGQRCPICAPCHGKMPFGRDHFPC